MRSRPSRTRDTFRSRPLEKQVIDPHRSGEEILTEETRMGERGKGRSAGLGERRRRGGKRIMHSNDLFKSRARRLQLIRRFWTI